jgi:hypothetical protein
METTLLDVEKLMTSLDELTKQHRKTSVEIKERKEAIKERTYSTTEYCKAEGISRMALYRRRDKGLVPYVMIEGEYRFLVPQEGGSNG